MYRLGGYAQGPAGHLDHFCVQPLAHFDATVRQQYGTIDVDEQQGAGLVQKRRTSREPDTVHRWYSCDASFLPPVRSKTVLFMYRLRSVNELEKNKIEKL